MVTKSLSLITLTLAFFVACSSEQTANPDAGSPDAEDKDLCPGITNHRDTMYPRDPSINFMDDILKTGNPDLLVYCTPSRSFTPSPSHQVERSVCVDIWRQQDLAWNSSGELTHSSSESTSIIRFESDFKPVHQLFLANNTSFYINYKDTGSSTRLEWIDQSGAVSFWNEYTTDADGRMTQRTTAAGQITNWQYNDDGTLKTLLHQNPGEFDRIRIDYVYDVAGTYTTKRWLEKSTGDELVQEQKTASMFNECGQLTEQTFQLDSNAPTTRRYSYDADGVLEEMHYPESGIIVTVEREELSIQKLTLTTANSSYDIEYRYQDGNLTSIVPMP